MTLDELETLSHTHPILVFDGICALCNRFIVFVDKRDKQNLFRYTTLQGDAGLTLREKVQKSNEPDTVILLYKGDYKTHSAVGIHVFNLLGYPYKIFFPFILIPAFIRDWVYRQIATNRYNWFGKTESCLLPEQSMRDKLIS